jgi:hypothetical protein
MNLFKHVNGLEVPEQKIPIKRKAKRSILKLFKNFIFLVIKLVNLLIKVIKIALSIVSLPHELIGIIYLIVRIKKSELLELASNPKLINFIICKYVPGLGSWKVRLSMLLPDVLVWYLLFFKK